MSWLMNAIQCQRTGKKKVSNTIGPPLVVTEKVEPVILDVLHEYSILVQLGYKHMFKRPVEVEGTKREVMLAIQNAVFGEFYDDLYRAMHLIDSQEYDEARKCIARVLESMREL